MITSSTALWCDRTFQKDPQNIPQRPATHCPRMRRGSEQLPPGEKEEERRHGDRDEGQQRSGPITSSLTVTTHTLSCTCVVLYISGPLCCRLSANTHTQVYTHSTGLCWAPCWDQQGFPQLLGGTVCPPGSASLTLALASHKEEHPMPLTSLTQSSPVSLLVCFQGHAFYTIHMISINHQIIQFINNPNGFM